MITDLFIHYSPSVLLIHLNLNSDQGVMKLEEVSHIGYNVFVRMAFRGQCLRMFVFLRIPSLNLSHQK